MTTRTQDPATRPAGREPLPWQAELVDRLVDGGVTVAAFVPDSRLDAVLTGLGERGVPRIETISGTPSR
jgi:hypothetical protein